MIFLCLPGGADVGLDSYSPVSEAYFDRLPFKFNGTIDKVHIEYAK